jgi:hypothetical protein
MASIRVDIDLNEIDTYELIDELDSRATCLDESEKQQLLDIVKYHDSEKWKWFLSIKDKYSLFELQELAKADDPAVASENQLKLAI